MFGWNKTVQHAWFSFLTFIIISIIFNATVFNPLTWILPTSQVFDTIIALMVGLSLVSISLMIARNHAFTFSDLVNPLLSPRRVLKFFALASLYTFPIFLLTFSFLIIIVGAASFSASVTLFGLILTLGLFFPTLYIAVRFKFFPFIVAEHEHSSVKDLIAMSYKATEGSFWQVLAFMVLVAALNLVGFLFFGVGLLLTVPTTLFAAAHLYDKFKNH